MKESDKVEFIKSLVAMAAVFRHEIKPEIYDIYWSIFSEYELVEFKQACSKCTLDNKFFPVPADIIQHIPSAQKNIHVGAEEAWAIAEEAMDEHSTVFVTNEILEAKVICQDLYDSGDKVGARMAFKDAYNRIIKTAQPPKWKMSEGYDKARKQDAIRNALALGRLSEEESKKYLRHESILMIGSDVQKVALELFQKIKLPLIEDDFESGIKAREENRKRFEEKRSEALSKLEILKKSLNE
jgi:hypothetical protein